MKLFSKQFNECSKTGMVGEGHFKSFDKNPELLPFCPTKAKKMIETGCKGIQLLECLRFGGVCSSKNIECQKMRTLINN